MKVTVIIPNFNGERYLADCLKSLLNQSYTDYEIVIVDNGSTDNSIKVAMKIAPQVTVYRLDGNRGFSAAVNYGIIHSNSEYVVLLNNDTIATETWLQNLIESIESAPEAFSYSSKMIQYYSPEQIDNAGDEMTFFGWAYQEGHGANINSYCTNREIFSSCAGSAIYRKKVFDTIGLFDENFFAYLEDVDIGYRARLAGYKNYYCASSLVYHIGSATTGHGYNPLKVKLSARNSFYLLYKNFSVLQWVVNTPFLIMGHLSRYFFYKRLGFHKDYLDGLKEGFGNRENIGSRYCKNSNAKSIYKIQIYIMKKGVQYTLKKGKKILGIRQV